MLSCAPSSGQRCLAPIDLAGQFGLLGQPPDHDEVTRRPVAATPRSIAGRERFEFERCGARELVAGEAVAERRDVAVGGSQGEVGLTAVRDHVVADDVVERVPQQGTFGDDDRELLLLVAREVPLVRRREVVVRRFLEVRHEADPRSEVADRRDCARSRWRSHRRPGCRCPGPAAQRRSPQYRVGCCRTRGCRRSWSHARGSTVRSSPSWARSPARLLCHVELTISRLPPELVPE